jgi:two-component system, cell cycle sensor histidine kinase and response regulator CckA
MPGPLRVLILEDSAVDAELMVRELRRAGFEPDWRRAQTEQQLLDALAHEPEVILSDSSMPGFSGLDALHCVRERRLDTPFIIVSGSGGEEMALWALEEGIDDCVLKDRLARLGLAVRNALERKRLRDNEYRQAAQLRLQAAAMEAAANSIIIADVGGTILWVNPAFTAVTGYSRHEAVGSKTSLVKSGKHDARFYQNLWQTILAGQCWHGEVINRRKDGSLYHEEMTITPVRTRGGAITHFIAVKQDVTGRKELEAQFLQAQKMECFGRLAGGVAHDFNNLLTVICGCSDIILAGQADREQIQELVTEIKRAGDRAVSLTQQLLAFSRKQILQPKVLDLNALLPDIEKMLRRLIGEDIQLVIEPGQGLRRVKADPAQIQQVLINLAVNARDAMPDGGKLTIATRNVQPSDVCCKLSTDRCLDDHAELDVSDTGCGMTPEVLARAFEPFFTTKDPGKGTGLGLATVHGIIAQSGGCIDVQTEPGAGTRFRIFLPSTQGSASELRRIPKAGPLARGETVLLVEDDPPVRTLAAFILRQAGYTVLEAESGKQAVTLLAGYRRPIHLMLTDVVMPEMSGRQLAEIVGPQSPETRILYMSGYLDDTIVSHGILESGLAFLHKPFTPASLLEKVREVLDQRPEDCRLQISDCRSKETSESNLQSAICNLQSQPALLQAKEGGS